LDIARSIRRAPCFAHLSGEEVVRLADCLSRVRVPAGGVVLRQNETSLDAYLVERGEVKIERDTSYGRYMLARLGPGELFGEANFVDQRGRSSEVVAATEADLLVLSQGAVSALTEEDQGFNVALHWAFWRSLSDKLRRANDHLTRFFGETGGPPIAPPPARRTPTGQFQIGLAAKRQLFAEQTLSSLEINFLASLSKEKKLAPGEVLFREGEAGDRMYVVLEGQVMISKFIPGAGEEALAFLERGDYFGEMALIDNQPRSAEAKAHGEGAVVLAIPRDVVEGILNVHKVSSLRLLRILCSLVAKRLREIDDKIVGWFMLSGGDSTPAPE
jgi:CRP-like cAMP-binding protein